MAHLTFIAVRSPKADVIQRLGLEDTCRVVDPAGAPTTCVQASSGWTILGSDEHDFASSERLALLSEGTEAVGCCWSSTVMAVDVWGYKDARESWSVSYDSDKDFGRVDAKGELPAEFAAIYETALREQAEDGEIDYVFDVPTDLIAALTGYHYADFDEAEFTALMPPRRSETKPSGGPKANPFAGLKRLFGRRGPGGNAPP